MAPHLSGAHYGSFLLRGDRGELVLLDALGSPEYKEFSTLLRACPEAIGKTDLELAELLRRSFSAPDVGENGGKLRMRQPTCPYCGSRETNDAWRAPEPLQFLEWEPTYATFRRWASLGNAEKEEEVRAALVETLKHFWDKSWGGD